MMYDLSESHMSARSSHSQPSSAREGHPHKCLCSFVQSSGANEEEEEEEEEESGSPLCPVCVQKALQPYWDRHAKAMADHARAREDCSKQLVRIPNHHNRLGELQVESERLRDRLMTLRKQCADMAVRVAAQAVENDSQREVAHQEQQILMGGNADGTQIPQAQLARLEDSLLQGSLHHALDVASKQVRFLRFQWARKALAMHRLDIDPNDTKMTPLQERRSQKTTTTVPTPRRARGIGKIGGLPLPHAGPELYGVLPPKELQSALRLVASVTCTVARCLGIVLPHPILLTPNAASSSGTTVGDITDTVSDHELQRRLRESHHAASLHDLQHPPTPSSAATTTSSSAIPSYGLNHNHTTSYTSAFGASSTASIMSLMDASYWKRSAKKALARATRQAAPSSSLSSFAGPSSSSSSPSSSSASLPSMDSRQLSLRIYHATAAVIAEDQSPSGTKFALSAEVMREQDFAIALQLLQNNVVVLCIRAGVPVSNLWPAEAVLLNLYQLDQYCQEQTAVAF